VAGSQREDNLAVGSYTQAAVRPAGSLAGDNRVVGLPAVDNLVELEGMRVERKRLAVGPALAALLAAYDLPVAECMRAVVGRDSAGSVAGLQIQAHFLRSVGQKPHLAGLSFGP
jgi:hypothetical protein